MRSYMVARRDFITSIGNVTVSLVHVTIDETTDYYEVAIRDTRALDLRKHRWVIVDSYADMQRGRRVFALTVGIVEENRVLRGMVPAAVLAELVAA